MSQPEPLLNLSIEDDFADALLESRPTVLGIPNEMSVYLPGPWPCWRLEGGSTVRFWAECDGYDVHILSNLDAVLNHDDLVKYFLDECGIRDAVDIRSRYRTVEEHYGVGLDGWPWLMEHGLAPDQPFEVELSCWGDGAGEDYSLESDYTILQRAPAPPAEVIAAQLEEALAGVAARETQIRVELAESRIARATRSDLLYRTLDEQYDTFGDRPIGWRASVWSRYGGNTDHGPLCVPNGPLVWGEAKTQEKAWILALTALCRECPGLRDIKPVDIPLLNYHPPRSTAALLR